MILNAKKCPFLTNKLFQGNKERNLQSLFKLLFFISILFKSQFLIQNKKKKFSIL
jgi:hypothetical protein